MNRFFGKIVNPKKLFSGASQKINVPKINVSRIDVSRIETLEMLMKILKYGVSSFIMYMAFSEINWYFVKKSRKQDAIDYLKMLEIEKSEEGYEDIDDNIYERYHKYRRNYPIPDPEEDYEDIDDDICEDIDDDIYERCHKYRCNDPIPDPED